MIPRVPNPLENARAITQTSGWLVDNRSASLAPTYYWSAGDAVTYFGRGSDGTPHLFQRTVNGGGKEAQGREGPAVHLRNGYSGQLSPDGKWFVEWHQNTLRQHIPTFISMEGKQQTEGKPTWAMGGIWTPGEPARLLCGVWRKEAALDVYNPTSGTVEKIAFPGLSHFNLPESVDASGELIGFKESNFILHYPGYQGVAFHTNYPSIHLDRVSMAHPEAAPEEWKVSVPEEIRQGICLLSPTRDRLLWSGKVELTPGLLKRLYGLIPSLKYAQNSDYRWYVSGLHGENIHEIAGYTMHPTPTFTPEPYSSPQWMPDGRHISFIYRNTLYTLPVD